MGLRGRVRRLESSTGLGLVVYHCSGCGERWKTPDALLDLDLYRYHQIKAERRGEEAPFPEPHVATVLEHMEHLGEDGSIRDITSGISVCPPPYLARD